LVQHNHHINQSNTTQIAAARTAKINIKVVMHFLLQASHHRYQSLHQAAGACLCKREAQNRAEEQQRNSMIEHYVRSTTISSAHLTL
jgi:hypothetical protein